MAMPLESKIMEEIGLGQHYFWFNGSGSCGGIRRHAAELLSSKIAAHAQAGEQIAPPDPKLIALMRDAAGWDSSDYNLTVAWQVASEVIATHIHGYGAATETARQTEYRHIATHIRQHYAPSSTQVFSPRRAWNHPDNPDGSDPDY